MLQEVSTTPFVRVVSFFHTLPTDTDVIYFRVKLGVPEVVRKTVLYSAVYTIYFYFYCATLYRHLIVTPQLSLASLLHMMRPGLTAT